MIPINKHISETAIVTDFSRLDENAIRLVGEDKMLITAGNAENFNAMTAGWGGFGRLWHMQAAFVFIRPQRYTFLFAEKFDRFTLSFFDKSYDETYNVFGTKSGRDTDKVKETGLIPVLTDGGIGFEQARLTLECRKLYADFIDPAKFIDKSVIEKVYPQADFHKMYVARILKTWIKSL